ncbi:MAG: Gfo/Idh/MocA family protein, partial [Armatimonadota bacterium]
MRIGIIGCGGIASEHVRGYRECDDVEIAAGADLDIQRAINLVGEGHAYPSYEDLLTKEKLDAVSVCTPPKFHKEAVCAALEAGVAVLCEKPLALNAGEARQMVECAERTGKLLVTAFCHRFHEPVLRAREIIRSGKIGSVIMFRNRFGAKMDMTKVWFSKPDVSGGGT